MATTSNFSLNFTDHGVSTTVPDDDLARLMYYLHSVTIGVGLDILPDDLIRYKHYHLLSADRIALVLQFAVELSPDKLIGKLIFKDNEHEVIEWDSINKFVTISAACNVVAVDRDVIIAGKVQNATKVMFFTSAWLERYYEEPCGRIARLILGTAHCRHCEGKSGVCVCSDCPRAPESQCTPFVDLFLGAITGVAPVTTPAPAAPTPSGATLRPDQHLANCDGCSWQLFSGTRYKCRICDDYDLCDSCYRGNVHDMWHSFYRIETQGATPQTLLPRAETNRPTPAPAPVSTPRIPPSIPPRRVPTQPSSLPRSPPSLPPRVVPTPPTLPPRVVPPPAQTQGEGPTSPLPPPPPYDASAGDGADPPGSTPAASTTAFFYETMSASDLKGFLKERGVAHDDVLDKETLCKRVWETHCDCMSISELNGFLSEQNISTADCRDINSRRQKAKDAFKPPARPVQPPAPPTPRKTDMGTFKFAKDDEVVLKNLTRAEMNGKRATVLSVDHGAGKVQIRVEELEKTFKVKAENLSLASELEEEELKGANEDEELE